MGHQVLATQQVNKAPSYQQENPRNDALAEQAARVNDCYTQCNICGRSFPALPSTPPDRPCDVCRYVTRLNDSEDEEETDNCCLPCDNEDGNEAPDEVNNNTPSIAPVEQETFWEKHAPGLSVLGLITLLILLIAIIALV